MNNYTDKRRTGRFGSGGAKPSRTGGFSGENSNGQNSFRADAARSSGTPRGDEERIISICALAEKYFPEADNPLDELIELLETGARDFAADRRDAEAYRDYRGRLNSLAEGSSNILGGWRNEEERIKETVPDFSLEEMLKNPEFRSMLAGGMGPESAYYAMKCKELQDAKDSRGARRPISQNAGGRSNTSGSGFNDIMSMSDSDFMKSIRKIINK